MYQEFFNFTELPFTIAPDPHFIYMSSRHQEGLAHLLYGINNGGGFVALTGEVGTGKTTLCHCLLERLPDEVDLALVLNPKLSAADLLATICDELAIRYDKYRQTLKHLVDCLNHYLLEAHANGRRTVLMIDEAQNLSLGVLEQIRLLTNLETSKAKLLQIILVGQPELQQLLASPKLRQLNQRITARYHLLPLTRDETGRYIEHRLKVCHGNPGLFNKKAIKRIHDLSGGIPRLINMICDRALLGAYVHDSHKVTLSVINRAAAEIDNQLLVKPHQARLRLESGALMLSMIAAAVYYWPVNEEVNPIKQKVIEKIDKKLEPVVPIVVSPPTVNEPVIDVSEVRPQPDLLDYLQKKELNLQQAFISLLEQWRLPPSMPEDCKQLEGLNCLTGLGDWRALMGLNRPVILELIADSGAKHYLLLIGVEQGRPVFLDQGREVSFSLHEVLSLWQGYYLLLWKSPQTGENYIYPKQNSAAVVWLRQQLDQIQNMTDHTDSIDHYYDASLQQRVRSFQQSKQLLADGIAGPLTLIHIQNAGSDDYGPTLRKSN